MRAKSEHSVISIPWTSRDLKRLTFRATMSSEGTGAMAAGGEGIAAGDVVFWTDMLTKRSGVGQR